PLLGFGFTLCSKLKGEKEGVEISKQTINVYIFEAFGAALSGAIFYFILAGRMDDFDTAFLLAIFNLSLFFPYRFKGRRGKFYFASSFIILYLLMFQPILLSKRIENWTYRNLWQGHTLIRTHDSKYGNLTVLKREEQYTLLVDNTISTTYPDKENSEERVHFAMIQHPKPHNVLILGGADLGFLEEILKYESLMVDIVEQDPEIPSTIIKYFPHDFKKLLEDDRVKINYSDPRKFVGSTDKKYDCVILNMSEPVNMLINRFYTKEFFLKVRKILNQFGVFAFSIAAGENFISTEEGKLLKCLSNTISSVFPYKILIPGQTCHFISSGEAGNLTSDPFEIIKRLDDRGVKTLYVSKYFLPFRLSPQRVSYFKDVLENVEDNSLNTDLKPICYYYDMVLWGEKTDSSAKYFFLKLSSINLYHLIFLVFIVFLSLFFGLGKKEGGVNLLVLFVLGFTLISSELILMVLFQLLLGYIYSFLGVIVSLFMIGMAVGSLYIQKQWEKKNSKNFGIIKYLIIYLIMLICYLPLYSLTGSLQLSCSTDLLPGLIFFLMAFLTGFMGGSIFVFASIRYMCSKNYDIVSKSSPSGIVYGTDLLGSCLGSLLMSSILIPLVGIKGSLALLILITFMTIVITIKRR
ncbi:hypothetical protein KKB18_12835, partial [bacterium]|nr:hypothetical protein [bacterium]